MSNQNVLIVGGALNGKRFVAPKRLRKAEFKPRPGIVPVSTAPEPEPESFIYNLVPVEIGICGTEFCIELTLGIPDGASVKNAIEDILDVYSCYCEAVAKDTNEHTNNEDLH